MNRERERVVSVKAVCIRERQEVLVSVASVFVFRELSRFKARRDHQLIKDTLDRVRTSF
jgi:hypothetical protein